MAQITFTISAENLPLYIEAFKEDYDQRILDGDGEPGEELEGITEAQYAKQNAFIFLGSRVRKFHKQKAQANIVEVDITK